MGLDIRVLPQADAATDVVIRPVPAGPQRGFAAAAGFTGGLGETLLLPGSPATVHVGLGTAAGNRSLRAAVAAAARLTGGFEHVAIELPSADAVGPAAEAYLLGRYRFTPYRTKTKAMITKVLDLIGRPGPTAVLETARLYAQAVLFARDLVNEPGGTLLPAEFARRACQVPGLTCEVWDERRITAEQLGGLIGVNRGSVHPARLVRLAYEPESPERTIALVGKGVTFDSGGLSIKTNQGMHCMKADMAGAAAVLAVMSVLGPLGCRNRVVGLLPLTDNMSGGDALRIGDILRTRSGKTVEVLNADAEGRLILADALTLAAESGPDAIVDIATLTDAISVALGRRYVGVGGNDPVLLEQVLQAGHRADELVWPMPADGVDRSRLDSTVADLVNAPSYRYGQSALGTVFLNEFVPENIPWAHLDISGPSFTDHDDGEWTTGGTGVGVRTLLELLLSPEAATS